MMKALQAAVLVVIGALGAVLYMKNSQSVPEAPAALAAVATPQAAAPVVPAASPAPVVTPAAPAPVTRPAAQTSRPKPAVRPSTPAPVASAPRQPDPLPAPTPVASNELPNAEPVPAPVLPRRVVVPRGTLVPVRLDETLASDKVQPGDTFSATLDQDLVIDGLVIADKGGRAQGRIVETAQSGKVKGVASLQVELTHLWTSDGQKVEISTEGFTKTAEKSTTSDAVKVGAGAAIGAVIGAIAGGGKGAAIGAGAGGAAGTGAVLATRGKAAVLPAETRLSFRLANAVTVQEKRKRT